MSAHILAFTKTIPKTFEEWQESINKLGLPLSFCATGSPEETQSVIEFKLKNKEMYVEMYTSPVSESSPNLLKLTAPYLKGRNIEIDFVYQSDTNVLCCALGAIAALMSDYDALCYDDFQSAGFYSKDKVLLLFFELLENCKSEDENNNS